MEEIQVRAEKHIKAKEDSTDQREAKHEQSMRLCREANHPWERNYKLREDPALYNLLKAKRAQILREVYHTHLLNIPQPTDKQMGPNKNREVDTRRPLEEIYTNARGLGVEKWVVTSASVIKRTRRMGIYKEEESIATPAKQPYQGTIATILGGETMKGCYHTRMIWWLFWWWPPSIKSKGC
ncbi:hypothetical protein CR513_37652, partial [Mucuna pruriens]